ncbi:hypothetical protein BS47DRAFT_236369 [Hydnum rufescens UP504]|uniref:Uncharacterized protein n=1 Tax=Hydnum rufescens UP504 TaxID=1448309 RepID=A0A9P6DRD8_9AGAM|nr:hypothetical protein BS47DRAFT_236369 [Hydnum rufescens UP504]
MAQHDTIIPRLRTLLMLHAILIISTAIYPSSGMPQAASVASVTPIYYVPPPPATSVQYASTSSYDFWWPYPSWVESSAAAAPTEPPSRIIADRFNLFPGSPLCQARRQHDK